MHKLAEQFELLSQILRIRLIHDSLPGNAPSSRFPEQIYVAISQMESNAFKNTTL